jgi:cyclase
VPPFPAAQVVGARFAFFASLADLTKCRDMLVVARDRVQKLKKAGKSAEETVASKPLADLDTVWGMLSTDIFVQMIYSAL